MAYSRFEVLPGRDRELCKNLDKEEFNKAVERGTDGVNKLYWIAFSLFILSLFIIIIGLVFTMFINSS